MLPPPRRPLIALGPSVPWPEGPSISPGIGAVVWLEHLHFYFWLETGGPALARLAGQLVGSFPY